MQLFTLVINYHNTLLSERKKCLHILALTGIIIEFVYDGY